MIEGLKRRPEGAEMSPEEIDKRISGLEKKQMEYGQILADYHDGLGVDVAQYNNALRELDRIENDLEKFRRQKGQ
ncbi:hypothetical protein EPN90_03835 [Patescibacteria group bacterium]|nr:MAG: hypothetical protein EPN90_03835 [Patescibacteria group bacterium]